MKLHEAKQILLTALFEVTPKTRAGYFRNEAEKSGDSLKDFYDELSTAYEALNKYVNSKDYSWGINKDDDGSEYYHLNIIKIDNFTDGRVLNNENITDLLKPLHDFGAYVLACETVKLPPQSAQAEQFAEYWYGITYKIMQCIGIEKQFIESTDKAGIMQFGKNKYKLKTAGQVFYRSWKDFKFNIPVEVKSFPHKDRTRWKEIVLTISENRAEVAIWLNKQVD
jgi:hypothetical protein